MLPRIRSTIARHEMLPGGARVIVAVSGGPDSVALLHLLREIAPGALAGIAHVNHRLRGEESEEDAAFVENLAAQFGVPFFGHRAAVPPEQRSGNLEQEARRERKAFFSRLIAEGNAERVALGHTRDDQAETVLFRLLRGSGPTGLAGILPRTSEGLIRPMLDVRRAEVHAYLLERNIPWREDSSNQSSRFARNRIRQTLLPALERSWNPNLTETLAHLADVSYEEERWWAAEVDRRAESFLVTPGAVEFPPAGHPRALLRRLIRRAAKLAKGNLHQLDFRHIEQVADLAQSGSGRVAIPGLTAIQSFGWLRLEIPAARPETPPVAVRAPATVRWPEHNPLIQLDLRIEPPGARGCDTLDLELRGWLPGDQYWPQGRHRQVKLKDLFQEARVPSWRRASWPILTGKGKILWAKDFGLSVDARGLQVQEDPVPG